MIVTSIFNFKGGILKSSTSLSMAYLLAEKGYKVLLIDADAQANSTDTLGYSPDDLDFTLYEVLTSGATIKESAVSANKQNLKYDLLPASPELFNAERDCKRSVSRDRLLDQALKKADNDYDFAIIDCAPHFSFVTLNALMASDFIIIPCEPGAYSLKGLKTLRSTISEIQEAHELEILGILLTKVDRANIDRVLSATTEKIAESLGTKTYAANIRHSKIGKEAPLHRLSVVEEARLQNKKNSDGRNVGNDYEEFVDEFLNDMKERHLI